MNVFEQTNNYKIFILFNLFLNTALFGQNSIQDLTITDRLKEIDNYIDRRNFEEGKKQLNKIKTDFSVLSEENALAIYLRKTEIEYYTGENEKSINQLLPNLEKLSQRKNSHLYYKYNSFIGQVFKTSRNFNKAIFYHKRALKNAEFRNDTLDIIFSCLKIGSCYYRGEYENTPEFYVNELDSTLFYYNQALKFPKTPENNSLLSRIYNNLSKIKLIQGNINFAEIYASKALKINRTIKNEFGIAVSLINLSNINYYRKEYKKAIINAKESNRFIENKSLSIKRDNLECIAKSYEKLGLYEQAYKFLNETHIISKNISNIISSKKINAIEVKYKLAKEKERTLDEKNKRLKAQLFLYIVFFLSILLMILGIFLHRRNRSYKNRFEEFMSNQQQADIPEVDSIKNKKTSELPIEIVKDILQKLDAFEEEKNFLTKNITLQVVAKKLNTNSSYLSKVVNVYKSKNFAGYINELRIQHTISELKNNKRLLLYTIEAIAGHMGYNNGESFSLAFKKITGLYPSYFIKQMKKNHPKHN